MCASRQIPRDRIPCVSLNLQTVYEHHRPLDIAIPVGVVQATPWESTK